MSSKAIYDYIQYLIHKKNIRILIEGPALCGKTTTISKAIKDSNVPFINIAPSDLYSIPSLSPISILERYIATGNLLFIDDFDTIFSELDTDFGFLDRFLSRKPNVIVACRQKTNVHPLALRYFTDCFTMEVPALQTGPITSTVSFDDIGGAKLAKDLIRMMASWCVTNASKVSEWGLTAPSGALLYGPPGTGKTLLAKAAANECGCRFLSVAIPDLLRCLVGESEKRLVNVFETARASAPSIIFIDEVQALFGRRGEGKNDSNRLVVTLLNQLDLCSKHGQVFCLAATNAVDAVDPALLQPGRFEEIIEVGLPDNSSRAEIIKIALKQLKKEKEFENDIEKLVKLTENLSASDIVGLCQRAALKALMDGRELTLKDIKDESIGEAIKRGSTKEISSK